MFLNSKFNGDISNWDVSNVQDMRHMFADSVFDGDISKWNVSKANDMQSLFLNSMFNGDISNWNVSKVKNMNGIFSNSAFDGDISKWKFHKNIDQSEESLAKIIKNSAQIKENSSLKMIVGASKEKSKNRRISI
jgi:surface protein